MVDISFEQTNCSNTRFVCDRGLARELRQQFSFYASNYKWDKRYKLGYWDGTISPFNLKEYTVPTGLLPRIQKYLIQQNINFSDYTEKLETIDLDNQQIINFFEKIGPFTPHVPQIDAFKACIHYGRNLILAPTSLGKSYIIHALNAWHKKHNRNILIIVHRAQLVLQLKSNFIDEYQSEKFYTTSTIYDKHEQVDTDVFITTWQSIKDYPENWFNQFDVIIGDEIHRHKAKVITAMMDKAHCVGYRHGFTATLDNDSEADALILEGIYGPPIRVTTLQEQIKQNISVNVNVYVVILKYDKKYVNELQRLIEIERKKGKEAPDFVVESKYLERLDKRSQIIAEIVNDIKGNTLVAYKNVEHGQTLKQAIEPNCKCPLFLINSKINKTKRFEIQQKITELQQSISVVSFGTFSEGINIPNLNNLVIASQIKSSITVPQLIGRMIRKYENKQHANVIEICDDLTYNGKDNIFLKHFKKRAEFYIKMGFNIKTKIIRVKP